MNDRRTHPPGALRCPSEQHTPEARSVYEVPCPKCGFTGGLTHQCTGHPTVPDRATDLSRAAAVRKTWSNQGYLQAPYVDASIADLIADVRREASEEADHFWARQRDEDKRSAKLRADIEAASAKARELLAQRPPEAEIVEVQESDLRRIKVALGLDPDYEGIAQVVRLLERDDPRPTQATPEAPHVVELGCWVCRVLDDAIKARAVDLAMYEGMIIGARIGLGAPPILCHEHAERWQTIGMQAGLAEVFQTASAQRTTKPEPHERDLPGISARTTHIRAQQLGSCPCLHVEPCDPRCTCVVAGSSVGCQRCCSYGSPEQQKAAAERLAGACTDYPRIDERDATLNEVERIVSEQSEWHASPAGYSDGSKYEELLYALKGALETATDPRSETAAPGPTMNTKERG